MRLCMLGVLTVLVCGGGQQVGADDWPEFRGPAGQGRTEANLPLSWSDTENITWKVEVPGTGWSSPVVIGDAVYLTTAISEEQDFRAPHTLVVLCLDAGTGQTRWTREVFEEPRGKRVEIHKKNSHASPTPVVSGDMIYVHFGSSGTACLTTAGEILWKTRLAYAPLHGGGGSPAVCGDVLVLCCDGRDVQYVTGLDRHTGKARWKTDRHTEASRGFSFSTPTIIDVEGKPQAVCAGSGKVVAYAPDTGVELWHVNYGEGYSVVPRPVFGHGLVYVCSGFDDARLFAIDPTGHGDVTETHVKWQHKGGVPQTPSVLLAGTRVFLVSDRGVATCLDALSGVSQWQQRLGGKFSASPTLARDRIYFLDEQGVTTVVAASPQYSRLAKNRIADGKERTFASFGVVDNAILLRTERHLYRIDP